MSFDNPNEIKFSGNYRLWKNWKAYCRLLDKIEFNCDFHADGSCFKHRKEKNIYNLTLREMTMCCCSSCHGNKGYLRGDNFLNLIKRAGPQNGKQLVKLWKDSFVIKSNKTDQVLEEEGFWRNKKGCILPRWARSALCLNYSCGRKDKYFIEIFSYLYKKRIEMIPVRKLQSLANKHNFLKK